MSRKSYFLQDYLHQAEQACVSAFVSGNALPVANSWEVPGDFVEPYSGELCTDDMPQPCQRHSHDAVHLIDDLTVDCIQNTGSILGA